MKCWSGGGTSSKSSPGSNLKQWVIIAAACSVFRADTPGVAAHSSTIDWVSFAVGLAHQLLLVGCKSSTQVLGCAFSHCVFLAVFSWLCFSAVFFWQCGLGCVFLAVFFWLCVLGCVFRQCFSGSVFLAVCFLAVFLAVCVSAKLLLKTTTQRTSSTWYCA